MADKPVGGAERRSLGSSDLQTARARSIIDGARDAIISIDSSGTVLDFNGAAESLFGYEREEILGKPVTQLMPSPDRERHAEYVERYERTGEARAIGQIRDVFALRKNGEIFPAELAVSEVRVADEHLYTAIVRDVSAYRLATEALKLERDFSERLIETTPFIVLVLAKDGRVVRLNRRTQEVTGFELDEVLNDDWFSRFIPERDHVRIRELFDSAMAGISVRGNVNPILTKGGEERMIRWYAEPLRNSDGSVESILCGGEDITEQTKASEELMRLERIAQERERLADIGALAARIVHDLGNPISGLSMQAQLLIRRVRKHANVDDTSLLQPAERILAAVDRLNTLIRGFMDFAREQRLDLEEVDLASLVQSVLDLWASIRVEPMIDFEFAAPAEPVAMRVDQSKIRRVLENIVKNAIDAIGTGPGKVTVTIDRPEADRVRILIADDGPGVAPGVDVFRLFETTKPQGTGIGLAVSKQIVLAHGGGIDFANSTPHGAVFTVELPVAARGDGDSSR